MTREDWFECSTQESVRFVCSSVRVASRHYILDVCPATLAVRVCFKVAFMSVHKPDPVLACLRCLITVPVSLRHTVRWGNKQDLARQVSRLWTRRDDYWALAFGHMHLNVL